MKDLNKQNKICVQKVSFSCIAGSFYLRNNNFSMVSVHFFCFRMNYLITCGK